MRAIRVGIIVLVIFSVLAHGAVETWSQSVLEIGAAALFLLWGVLALRGGRTEIRWNPLFGPLLAFGGFVLLQWLFGLSLYPYLTRVEFVKLLAYFVLFFLAVQCFRNLDETRPFVWSLLVFGFVVALFGIIQYFSFNEKLYWVREFRAGIPFGPYVNRNHFAGFVELVVPLGLAQLFFRSMRPDKLHLVRLFTIVPIGALFLSASRGGILSFLCQLGLAACLVSAHRISRKWLMAATGVLLVAGAFVMWLGIGHTMERFAQLWSVELSTERRAAMLKDTWQIFLDHPWKGTGLGTLVAIYPGYASVYDGRIVDHAHNDYVEMMAETGFVGLLLGLAFLVLLFRSALSRLGSDTHSFALALRVGGLVACSGIVLHSLVDFNLHIPSNALLFLLQASLATSRIEQQNKGSFS